MVVVADVLIFFASDVPSERGEFSTLAANYIRNS